MTNDFQNETFDETFTYRDITVQIWNDDYGQQKFIRFLNDPIFGTQDISLGSYNFNYKEDIKYIIDEKLDVIHYFSPPYHGAQLRWFDNGYYNRDIKLVYRSRAIKIFLVEDPHNLNLIKVIEESERALKKYINLTEHTIIEG